jgi:multiple sugar transport system substrate-binding protein
MMSNKRRKLLKAGAGLAAGTAMPFFWVKDAGAQQWSNVPEKGAKLRVLRWSRFVQGDIDQYMKNVAKFTEKTGIEVRIDNEGWEDVRPKAAVAANTGAGPDIILSTNDDANLYPEKLVDVTDVCTYLGAKYGGWYPVCEQYLKPDGKKWIGVPLGCAGNALVYRASMLKAAGFDGVPKDTDGFLKLCKALKEKNTRPATAIRGRTGSSGRMAARWSTPITRWSSTARRRSRRSSTRRSSTRHSCPERFRGSTRTTTRRSSTARSR